MANFYSKMFYKVFYHCFYTGKDGRDGRDGTSSGKVGHLVVIWLRIEKLNGCYQSKLILFEQLFSSLTSLDINSFAKKRLAGHTGHR